ncbi:energy-coupling factor ABC transporter ATP-binding protein [Nocardioides rotundus]|uniref:energy-coupling factor ABC transporter ATP-binding protein n=1 Tax=Nocardioides rotundus TaxID=1774216 RepID=UPI001CBDFADC|nr:ABC transporter ATP-binding protein [Nocardioides rotundus]UAL29935.1 energy-coupling factor ABC transporter ATP-binding protein [Nocardioides rotundus]
MLIDIKDVSHRYAGRAEPVVDDLSVRLDERRVAVIGANGSGKSTFARMLNGLVIPSAGTVKIGGLDTSRHGRQIRKKVGFCFTDPDTQIVMPTVAEDVAFGLRRRGWSKAEIAARVHDQLATYGLDRHAEHAAHLLSGGQKQLLALASILITEPDLLVMDEPTTLLDLRNTQMFADLVSSLPQQVVMVTHDLDLLADFDRVLVFDQTRLVHDGPPAEAVAFYRALMRVDA